MKKKYLFFFLLALVSCVSRKTNAKSGYRLVGKDGKVIYFEKKRSQFNEEQLKKQTDVKKDKNATSKKLEKVNNSEAVKQTKESLNKKEEILADSSAYSLRSVMDNIVKNDDINTIAKKVENSPKSKSIKDFDDIPDVYFENTPDAERLTVKQNENYLLAKKVAKQNKNSAIKTEPESSLIKNKYYLQIGSFKSRGKAERLLNRSKSFGSQSQIVESKMKDFSIMYKVLLGPFNTNTEANSVKKKVVDGGYLDAFTFKN
ncbi:MAG: SPOR domain-containing protein [Rickettsiales bacterium]|nr:SPOR domain-containing protein [Rickettsiales bacterium]